MSKVITFSRTYQAGHPKVGEPTYFVEKIVKGFLSLNHPIKLSIAGLIDDDVFKNCQPKWHTIRAGYRLKAGECFSPRIWSAVPYRSKQITIAPDVEIKKTWDFDIEPLAGDYILNGNPVSLDKLKTVALNDGLEVDDFECWFKLKKGEGFRGQIICWNDKIDY